MRQPGGATMRKRLFKNRDAWRAWLEGNHASAEELWLVYYKKATGKASVAQPEAVEEALCFGWIDSIVKTIDDQRYMQRFTPRRDKSNWSRLNKERVTRLERDGKMTAAGRKKIDAAKKDGSWTRLDVVERDVEVPAELKAALASNRRAQRAFAALAPSVRKQWSYWVVSGKRDETRRRRARETVKRVLEGRKPGY